MRVALVGSYPEPGRQIAGGVERVVEALRRELASQVELAVFVPGAEADREIQRDGARIVYLKRGPGPGVVRYATFDAWKLARALDRFAPDVVHVQGAAGVGRGVRQPALVTVHGVAERDILASGPRAGAGRLARLAAAAALRGAEAAGRRHAGSVIVINPYVTEVLPDTLALRRFDIPNPLDREFCVGPVASDRPRRMVSVGRIGPLKNTLRIVEIAGRVMAADPQASLTLCGAPTDEGYAAACRQAVRDLGVEDRVHWAGNLDTLALIEVLDGASCLIMASLQENAPMAIAEANARGVAAIAPQAFGIRYMIQPGDNGVFLPDGDIEAQVAVVRGALDHGWDRNALTATARATYAPDVVARRTLEVYRKLVDAKA